AQMRVVRRQFRVHPGQVQNGSNLTHPVIVRHDLIEAERIKQLSLLALQPPHHGKPHRKICWAMPSHCSPSTTTDFCNEICHEPTSLASADGTSTSCILISRSWLFDSYIALNFVDLATNPKWDWP